VIVHGEGLAGCPHQSLGGKTPLQAAATPNLDQLARTGEFGLASTAAEGLRPGADVAQLALLGYDPRKYHAGPASFEAASLGVALGEHDVAYRCSLVTLRTGAGSAKVGSHDIKKLSPQHVMEDATAGGIDSAEARELIMAVNDQLGSEAIQFYPGIGHRHLMVWVGGKARATCVDPQDILGRPIGEFLPHGDGSDILRRIMESSAVILREHPVNADRRDAGLKPANCVWLWGHGRAVRLPKMTERYRIGGAVLAFSDLRRGIGICAGLEPVELPPVAGDGDEALAGLAEAAVRELGKKHLVCLHVEAPAAGLQGDPKEKVRTIEAFDREVVGRLMKGLAKLGPHRLLVFCDHGGTTGGMTPSPYVFVEGPAQTEQAGSRGYNEADAQAAQGKVRDASRLITRLFPEAG